jgi:hypothetical protein
MKTCQRTESRPHVVNCQWKEVEFYSFFPAWSSLSTEPTQLATTFAQKQWLSDEAVSAQSDDTRRILKKTKLQIYTEPRH